MKPVFLRNYWILALAAFLTLGCGRQKSESHAGNSPLFIDETTLKKGDIIQPFAYIDPSEHDWKVEIRISGEDLLDIGIKKKMNSRKFWTSKRDVLEEISSWKFVYGRKSSRKASSTLRVYRDNQMIDKHGIVLERHTMGFQSTKFGMLMPVDEDILFDTIDEMNHF